MDRRKFINQSCTGCLAVSSGMLIGSLTSCGAALPVYHAVITDNKIAVPEALFANSNFQLIAPKRFFYNIGLKKEDDGSFTALLMRCTHADNQLMRAGAGFKCTLHGSAFNAAGQVTKGPAEHPLKKYFTEVVAGYVIIHLS